jgi:hypothetical protein
MADDTGGNEVDASIEESVVITVDAAEHVLEQPKTKS